MNKKISMRSILTVGALIMSSVAFSQNDAAKRVNAAAFEKGIQKDSIQIVDVRTEQEFRSGHIKNALLINWNDEEQFNERVKYLEKQKPVYVYCLAGSRSQAAANWMKKNGFTNVIELEGGMNAWKKANLPVEGTSNEKIISFKEYTTSIAANGVTLVNVGSPGCPPCKKMEPVLNELKNNASVKFTLMNVDAGIQTEITKALNIEPIPVFIIYKKGKEVWRKQGLVSKEELLAKLQ